MPNTTTNGIQIEYETFGERPSPPPLLILGLSDQMIGWEEEFCKQLVEKGLFVIRFDNRDVGLSTKFEEAGIPDIVAAMQGQEFQAAYSLDDMADDSEMLIIDGMGHCLPKVVWTQIVDAIANHTNKAAHSLD